MGGCSVLFGLIVEGSVVVLVEMETCWPRLVRLNLASDGEQELKGDRLRTSDGGRGSARGWQKSRRGECCGRTCDGGDQAGGTRGIMKRRADLMMGRCGDINAGERDD